MDVLPFLIPAAGLTVREAEVLGLIAGGLSNSEIARRLVVSEATVRPTSTTCSPKRACATARKPVGYAYRHGLVAD